MLDDGDILRSLAVLAGRKEGEAIQMVQGVCGSYNKVSRRRSCHCPEDDVNFRWIESAIYIQLSDGCTGWSGNGHALSVGDRCGGCAGGDLCGGAVVGDLCVGDV